MKRALRLVDYLLEEDVDEPLELLKNSARQYALNHGLTPEQCCLVVGRLNGKLVCLGTRPGMVRWAEDRNFQRDGGVFPNQRSAESALEEVRTMYGAVDRAVTDIEIVAIHGRAFAA